MIKNWYLIVWFSSAVLFGYSMNESMDVLAFCAAVSGYLSSRELSELS